MNPHSPCSGAGGRCRLSGLQPNRHLPHIVCPIPKVLKIGVKIDNREVKKLLNDAIKRGRNMTPAFEAVGETVRASVMKNFEVGGRPKEWAKSKKAEGKTLVKSGILAGSIKSKAYGNRAEVGTNVPYAAIHHAGGTIKAHKVTAPKGGALRLTCMD